MDVTNQWRFDDGLEQEYPCKPRSWVEGMLHGAIFAGYSAKWALEHQDFRYCSPDRCIKDIKEAKKAAQALLQAGHVCHHVIRVLETNYLEPRNQLAGDG